MINEFISPSHNKFLCNHVMPYIEKYFDESGSHSIVSSIKLTDELVRNYFMAVAGSKHMDVNGEMICLDNQPERLSEKTSKEDAIV